MGAPGLLAACVLWSSDLVAEDCKSHNVCSRLQLRCGLGVALEGWQGGREGGQVSRMGLACLRVNRRYWLLPTSYFRQIP